MSFPILTVPAFRRVVNNPEQRPATSAAAAPYQLVGPPRIINPITGASQPGPPPPVKWQYDPLYVPFNVPPQPPPPTTNTGANGYEIGTSPLETPASGNIAPSTSPYATIDPTTGIPVGPTTAQSITNTIGSWVQNNPVMALFLAGLVVYIGMEMFGKGGGGRRR